MMAWLRMDAESLAARGVNADEVVWADALHIDGVFAGIAGFWASGLTRLALISSAGNHAMTLPALVNRLLEAENIIYVTAADPEWADYCRRAAGLCVAEHPVVGPIFALTRQRCPWWPGPRDPDFFPDGELQWKSRARPVPQSP
jgi:hypothetical protein